MSHGGSPKRRGGTSQVRRDSICIEVTRGVKVRNWQDVEGICLSQRRGKRHSKRSWANVVGEERNTVVKVAACMSIWDQMTCHLSASEGSVVGGLDHLGEPRCDRSPGHRALSRRTSRSWRGVKTLRTSYNNERDADVGGCQEHVESKGQGGCAREIILTVPRGNERDASSTVPRP